MKFGEVALIWYWWDLDLAIRMISIIRTHELSLNLRFYIWELLKNFPKLLIAKLKTSPKFPALRYLQAYMIIAVMCVSVIVSLEQH